jgi:hypothetical protein
LVSGVVGTISASEAFLIPPLAKAQLYQGLVTI